MTNTFSVRDVLLVEFPIHTPLGREQQGQRPAVVVALPGDTGSVRFSLVVVVPTTAQSGDWVAENPTLYPFLPAGVGGIRRNSIVLLDQIRAIDVRRVLRYRGTLTPDEYQPIEDGLKAMFRFLTI
ncbi:type II toxin-antitoxin system PemK/MazF family toxin [Coleofasciculus sp. H7-2]|uniref:type II toxin-antitoxin system PemK/MazF family toxin n=1 Tax=Coleofasciculus sp. H7-2 TaxID=3351545 RepID=UPI0036714154